MITARREAALEKATDEIREAGGEVYAVAVDISKLEDSEKLMDLVMNKYGKIDILVNNAGILEEGLKPIDRFSDEDLDRIVETNEKGTMRCMRVASKLMLSGASIVKVASFSAGRNPLQCNLPGKCHHTDDNRNRSGSTRSRHDRSHGNTQQSEDTILYSAGCGECHPVLRK